MTSFNPFPLTIPILWAEWMEGKEDILGNVTGYYKEHPDPVMVFGVEPSLSTEPELAGEDRVVVDAKIYAGTDFRPGPHDRITVRGMEYDVIGYPQDADLNPFWRLPMATVLLKRVESGHRGGLEEPEADDG